MESEWQQRGFRVRGRVHGVGFRWWARRRASNLGLRGTVGNRSDGTVEVHAAGEADALEEFAKALKVGPPMARVEAVEVFPSEGKLPTNFDIV